MARGHPILKFATHLLLLFLLHPIPGSSQGKFFSSSLRRLLALYSGPVQTVSSSGDKQYLKLCETTTCKYRQADNHNCFVPAERWQKSLTCTMQDVYRVQGNMGGNTLAHLYFNLRSPWSSNCTRVRRIILNVGHLLC